MERSCTQSREVHFNPLPPHGGRRTDTWQSHAASAISIHSLRMEGDDVRIIAGIVFCISIHSLRMEGDTLTHPRKRHGLYFNPLPPHGGRPDVGKVIPNTIIFQSTPSAWRETDLPCFSSGQTVYFNPLPPHGGRLLVLRRIFAASVFQSTPSAWRETSLIHKLGGTLNISIHSLRMEGDLQGELTVNTTMNFNPLPPHGGRLANEYLEVLDLAFQSTPSAWRETRTAPKSWRNTIFQSTPSAWRETCWLSITGELKCYFNPLPPHGGRR